MTERSYFWDGTEYAYSDVMDIVFRALTAATGNKGVLNGWLNELEVVDGGVDTATVSTGGALIYGMFYENDAAKGIDVAAYRGGSCLIVARKTTAAQTVRAVARAAGALTQTAAVYEIPLASVAVDGAGALTITDTREFCLFPFYPGDGSIWTVDLADETVVASDLENQDRWRFHGVGRLKEDATNPPAFGLKNYYYTEPWDDDPLTPPEVGYPASFPWWDPNNIAFRLETDVEDALWLTERVPEDITGGLLNIYAWNTPATDENKVRIPPVAAGNVRWAYSAWIGASNVPSRLRTGARLVSNNSRLETGPLGTRVALKMFRDLVGQITVTAGELVHVKVYRDGAHTEDTMNLPVRFMGVELAYTADS